MINVIKEEINASITAINEFVQTLCELNTKLEKSSDFPDLFGIHVYSSNGQPMASIFPQYTYTFGNNVALIRATIEHKEIIVRLFQENASFEWENHDLFLEQLKSGLLQQDRKRCFD